MFDQPYLRFEGGLLGVGFASETLQLKTLAAADIRSGGALFDELVVETPGFLPERGLRSRLQVACIQRAFELLGADYRAAMAATVSFGTIELKFDQIARCLSDNAELCGRFGLILRGDIERMQQWQRLRPLARLAQELGAMVVLRQPLQGIERVRALIDPDLFTLESVPGTAQAWKGLASWMDRRGIALDGTLLQDLDTPEQLSAARAAGFVFAQGHAVATAHEAPHISRCPEAKRRAGRRDRLLAA